MEGGNQQRGGLEEFDSVTLGGDRGVGQWSSAGGRSVGHGRSVWPL